MARDERAAAAVQEARDIEAENLGGESNPELLPKRDPWRSILHGIGVAEQIAGASLLVVILILVLAQVAIRDLPGVSAAWTGEIARLSMVWMTFLMAGYLAAHDRHISIQVVDFVLGQRARAGVRLFADIVVLVTCVVVILAIYQLLAEDIGQVTAAAELPLWIVNFVPIIGFTLTAVRMVIAIIVRDLPALAGAEEAA
jgi:TRAP-type C4-dicarboxylate transport system permease small subunit